MNRISKATLLSVLALGVPLAFACGDDSGGEGVCNDDLTAVCAQLIELPQPLCGDSDTNYASLAQCEEEACDDLLDALAISDEFGEGSAACEEAILAMNACFATKDIQCEPGEDDIDTSVCATEVGDFSIACFGGSSLSCDMTDENDCTSAGMDAGCAVIDYDDVADRCDLETCRNEPDSDDCL